MKRRTFIAVVGLGSFGLLLLTWVFRNKVNLLQLRLSELGFEVEKEEVRKFWQAWISHRWGAKDRHWKYHVKISLEYPLEPLDETIRMFLLSSNALRKKKGEKIIFLSLYHPYHMPCSHPFWKAAG